MNRDQAGLYTHWRKIANQQENDFRATALKHLVLRYINKKQNVLDLGCGTCDTTLFLKQNHINVYSVDAAPEMVNIGKKILDENGFSTTNIYIKDINTFASENVEKFDQVVCLDVIEHIRDDVEALNDIFSLLKPGGKLIITVPALSSLYGQKDIQIGHYRRYNRSDLLIKLLRTGFIIKQIRYWNIIGVPITFIVTKIFKTRVNEGFRYNRSIINSLLQQFLTQWFLSFENNINFGFGLTLFVVAHRPKTNGTN